REFSPIAHTFCTRPRGRSRKMASPCRANAAAARAPANVPSCADARVRPCRRLHGAQPPLVQSPRNARATLHSCSIETYPEPRLTSSAKEGVGTAYHTSCRVWFTLSHGIVNEIYYPHVDQPNTRDFQYLISDGETFCHEEKRDLDQVIEYPERDCLFYRLTNSEPGGRYRLVKHVLTDPHGSVLLVHTKLEVFDQSLDGKLHVYALLAPHIAGCGTGNSAWCSEIGGQKLFHAQRETTHL